MTRVAVYCRVSTDKTDQIHSFQSQRSYFQSHIAGRPDWTLTEIYTDEGITGTTTSDRPGFLEMIGDATRGNFDLIVTKEVSRFSRNILDAIFFTRRLKELGVGVIFLNDGISTLDSDAELRLGIMASVAQEESRRTSERVRWGQMRRMERGVVFGPSLLGYTVKNGSITVEPSGADTVRRIYRMYLYDRMGVRAIADSLMQTQTISKTGSVTWSGASILKIIRNEKYCGDLVQRKTVTTDYLTHKREKNATNDLISIRNHHEPIISREEWEAVQAELKRRSTCPGEARKPGIKYILSGKVVCAGCGAAYHCRTRKRKDGSKYRVWMSFKCICSNRTKQIREDIIIQIMRRIIAKLSGDMNSQHLFNIIERILRDPDCDSKPFTKQITQIERKSAKLIDIYLAGDIKREEYRALKAQYEEELKKLHNMFNLQNMPLESSDTFQRITQVIQSFYNGSDNDNDFYLNFAQRIEVVQTSTLCIIMSESGGKWLVEF